VKYFTALILLIIFAGGVGYYLFFVKNQVKDTGNPMPSATTNQMPGETASPTPYPDTQSAIEAFLANKYQKPVSEVHVTVNKEVQGFASGSVMFGEGGPGEGGMWLAVLGNGWEVVWDGNGNVDCTKMRQDYGFPDTILKPNFCD
jgi:hypothetical protein